MRLRHIPALPLMLLVAACLPKLDELSYADMPVYKGIQAATNDNATIRGVYEEGTFFGRTSQATYISAIDGEAELTPINKPVIISSGPHAILIGYLKGSRHRSIAVRLDAEAGKKYLIVERDGENTGSFLAPRWPNWLSIVEEPSGKIVVPPIPDLQIDATNYFEEPVGPDVATVRGTRETALLDIYSAYVLTIDGVYVKPASDGAPRYDATYRITPGLHAIGVGFADGLTVGAFPFLVDVRPSTHYVLRLEHGLKRIKDKRWETATLWIEDETTGEIIAPKVDLPLIKLIF